MNSVNYHQIGAKPWGGGGIPGNLWWGRARQQKDFLKSVSSSHISPSFFLIYLEFKRQIGPSTPEIPQKPYPNSDQNRQRLYPFSDQIGAKTLPDGTDKGVLHPPG